MRNNYLCLLCLAIFSLSFSQAPIVTIDRANGTGPTTTGNDTNMTSTGIVRGTGISQAGGGDFNSNQWDGTDLATAQTANDFLEWTATGDATFTVDVTEIDIRVDRSNTGPTTWQILYSLDGFTTAGIDITGAQTANTSATNFNFPSLTISSGAAGTITFRLFAWGASNTSAGTFDIEENTAWAGFGITDPGIRLTGTIDAPAGPADADSDITATVFDPTDNIDYTSFSAASGLTTGNAIKIGEFEIRDGGATAPDADALATTLTDLEFIIVNSNSIAALAIFDGATNVSESTSVSASTAFTGLSLAAADDATKTFDVYATFKSSVTDNAQIALTVDAATADVAGSTFAAADAGGAATPTLGDDNRIEVTGTLLAFLTQPNITNTNSVMSPAPVVASVDTNNNIDEDFVGTVTITSTGSLDGASTTSEVAATGSATFSNLIHDTAATGLTLTAASVGFTNVVSTTFSIVDAVIEVIAQQRFDFVSTPVWNYTNDVAFFDSGWGSGGFYGIRPAVASTPLSNASFADFILGENDLQSAGGGTSGFATFTLATIDISAVINATVSFDWEVIGYDQTNDQAIYELVYDGVDQGEVLLAGGGITTSGSGLVSIAVPDTVSQIALKVKLRNNGSSGYSGFDNFLLTGSYAGLIYNGTSWSPSAPDSTTGSEDAIILSGTPDITTDVVLNNVSISTGAGLNVTVTGNLTVNGNIDTGNNLILCAESDEFPSLIVYGTATGLTKYKRYVNTAFTALSNELVSAPLAGQTFSDFASENPNLFRDPTPGSDLVLFGPFNNITGNYETYSEFDTTVMPSGIGYRAGRDATFTPTLETFTFSGTIPTADVDVTLSRQPTGTNFEWNSVGNPFPSYIFARDFLLTNNADFDVARYGIYGYDGNAADGWDILNLANTTTSTKLVPAQGFLVAAAVDGAVITFEANKRVTGTTDDFIPLDAGDEETINYNAQFGITSGDNSYRTEVYFNEASTLSLDPGYDAALFGTGAPEFSIYTKLVDNNSDNDFAIQSLPHTNVDNVIIPLGINIAQGQQATIKINNHTLPQGVNVYLEDNVANTFTLLNSNDYVFTSSTTLTDTGRFFLHFEAETLSNPENTLNALQIYNTVSPSKALFVKGRLDSGAVLNLIDIQGRTVLSSNLNNNVNSHKFDISNINSGVYIVNINNNSSSISQKIIIR